MKLALIVITSVVFAVAILIAKAQYDQYDSFPYNWVAPWPLYTSYKAILKFSNWVVKTQLTPPALQVMDDVGMIIMGTAIHAVTKLKVPDALHERELAVKEIAALVGAHEETLYKTMKDLSTKGYFRETKPRSFKNTPMTDILREGHEHSMRDIVLVPQDLFFSSLDNVVGSIKTGKSAFETTHGKDVWSWIREKDMTKPFANSMSSMRIQDRGIVADLNITGCNSVVDIGGNLGVFLKLVLDSHPGLKGILFDQPEVIALVEKDPRIQLVGGDFLKEVPQGDCYFIKNVLSDWDDDHVITILKNIVKKMNPQSKLFIVNIGDNFDAQTAYLDLTMMYFVTGRTRPVDAFLPLIEQAGLKLTKVTKTRSPSELIQLEKI
jgi:hypothetical protein